MKSRSQGPGCYNALRAFVCATVVASMASGCGGWTPSEPDGPYVRFSLAPGDDFYALPFPIDTRLTAEGLIDLSGFVPGEHLVEKYLVVVQQNCRGFALGGGVFFTFSEPVDTASLPADAAATLAEDASVYLVNVDAASAGYGERVPLWIKFEERASRFISANWLGLIPYPGYPLRRGTTYAAVVTRRVRTTGGEPFGRDRDFAWVMGRDGPGRVKEARRLFEPFTDYLADHGIDPGDVAAATVFTTQDVVEFMARAREKVRRDVDTPVLRGLSLVSNYPDYDVYEGQYDGPIFQQGDLPYRTEGGEIRVDENGEPILASMMSLRVAFSVPRGVMPQAGWPVVLYAHGTGGNYMTFVNQGTALNMAMVRDANDQVIGHLAVMGIDAVMHGPRIGSGGGSPSELFYNFQNPLAARDNSRQAAIDYFQLVRLAESVDVASAPVTGEPIRFDPDRIYYMGHSQGGITGALFVPAEPAVRAAVLSGTGAHLLLTLMRKTTEFDIPTLLSLALNDQNYGELDDFHPVLSLLQTFIEPADPLSFARNYLHDLLPGMTRPVNVYLSYGIDDNYTPNITTAAFATAGGFAPAGTILDPYEGMELMGQVVPLAPPVCDNFSSDAGSSTAVTVQYPPNSDGHYVVFDVPEAIRQSTAFLAAHAASGCATLVQ